VVIAMQRQLKARAWRVVLGMAALASYAFVLEAGRRW
jgi:hypothetical protein